MNARVKRFVKAISIGAILFSVFGFTIYQFYKQAWVSTDRIMADHIEQLVSILKKIDDTCEIVDIAHERSYIDFLNVRSFSGSEVGALNLVYPDKWKGPYLLANYTMQGKLYEIIKTNEGYYVVPGEGVQLSNKKVIGRDIKFTKTTDIESFVNNKIGLEYDGRPLAVRLPIKAHHTREIALLNQPGFQEEE